MLVLLKNKLLDIKLQSPLEQFEINNLFFASTQNIITLWQKESDCPSDIWTEINNFFPTAIYTFKIYYGLLHYYFLSYFTNSLILIIFAAILLNIVSFISIGIINDKNLENFVENIKASQFNLSGGYGFYFILQQIYDVVKTILKSNTQLQKKEYFEVLYFLFLFITLANVGGLIPYTFTLTSSFIVTFFLAASHFVGINFIALFKNNWNYFNMFLPSGVPLVISPFLVLIELISYIAKVFSLSIRLFANMMAGHALLKILIGFSWAMLASGSFLLYIPAMLPWAVVTAIIFLEILIAFLQSYVFTVLVAIYINDVFSAH